MASLYDLIGRDVVDEYLENSEDLLPAKQQLADEFVAHARSIAPVDEGDYRDGIVSRKVGKAGVGIYFTDEISELLEYGTIDTPEYAVRRRTIEYFGGQPQ